MIPAEQPAKLSVSISSGMTVEIRLGLKEARIGRGRECDLLLPDPAVSRLHARIFRVGNQYFLADASRNGTLVDGRRIGQLPLEDGMVFRIGPYRIHFLRGGTPGMGAEPPTVVAGAQSLPPRDAPRHSCAPVPEPAGMIGKSPCIRRLADNIARVAPSGFPVLVEGETGSGKELVSRGIHDASPRRNRPFVVVNCGAISPELIESELFGHEKGSFTGATAQRKGAFEVADGGTIFLDEIGELPLSLQPKLLRALEQKEIKRVGGNDTLRVDVRILAATNRNLREEVTRRNFRDDLYYRISAITLRVPPLRERREDIPLLAARFLEEIGERQGQPPRPLSGPAGAFLASCDWPGNVRELRNAVQRAVVMSDRSPLEAEDFDFLLAPQTSAENPAPDANLSRWEQSERNGILSELARQNWNKTATARSLGIAKSTLFEKLKKYAIGTSETVR